MQLFINKISLTQFNSKRLQIPRLQLIAAQILPNLAQNIKKLTIQNIRSFNAWSSSSIVLHLSNDKGEYKGFLSSPVATIGEKNYHFTKNDVFY